MLTRQQAKAFYDRFGAKQDKQAFYEDPPLNDLISHADFEHAHSVFEFGCGTGRFAEQLLDHHLPSDAIYRGIDLSDTMVALARQRLGRFGERANVDLSDGSAATEVAAASVDAFVSNYVLDLLPGKEIDAVLAEARRLLSPDGHLCMVSATWGRAGLARFVSWLWSRLHALRPALVGGCRPLNLVDQLDAQKWVLCYQNLKVASFISSEIVVASPA
jgi:ubiquinone/menaquinone biosynthesis C-methylase UbiE